LGAYSAWSLLRLGVTTPVRELLPADPAPTFVVEIRDAARIVNIDWFRQDILDPLLSRAIAHPEYGVAVTDLLAGSTAPWPAIGAALGDDAVVARYAAGDSGAESTLAIVATRPSARLALARQALAAGWPKDGNMTRVDVGLTGVSIYYATVGRLVIAATDVDLARRATAVIDGADGFLAASQGDTASRLALRAANQSSGRSASVYARSDGGETLAELAVHRSDWSASIWVPGAPTLSRPEAVSSARAEARRVAGASSAVFWHAGTRPQTLHTLLATGLDISWTPTRGAPEPVPIVVTIPAGEASGAILPELAVTTLTPSAPAARDALLAGRTEVVFQGSRASVTADSDGAAVGLPLGFGLRYPVHMGVDPGALTFATTKRALTPLRQPGARGTSISLSTQRQADLFQLVAEGVALHTLMTRTLALMKLAKPPSEAVSAASRTLGPLLTRTGTIVASGVAAPDGFRVDIHGPIGAAPVAASAP